MRYKLYGSALAALLATTSAVPSAASNAIIDEFGCDYPNHTEPGPLRESILEDPQSGLDYVDELRGFGGCDFEFVGEIIALKRNERQGRYVLDIKVSEESPSLSTVVEPAQERDRKVLQIGSDVWLYLPNTRNTIRIALLQRLFGTLSLVDVLGADYFDNYTAESASESTCGEIECIVLTARLNEGFEGIDGVEFSFDSDSLKLIESKHFSPTGRLIRNVIYHETEEFLGQRKLTKLEVINPLEAGTTNWVRFSGYAPARLDERMFVKESIRDF